MTNIVEIMSQFVETSNITIKPKQTRVHRLVILLLLYSFGASVDISSCKEELKETGVDIGDFSQKCAEVRHRQEWAKKEIGLSSKVSV